MRHPDIQKKMDEWKENHKCNTCFHSVSCKISMAITETYSLHNAPSGARSGLMDVLPTISQCDLHAVLKQETEESEDG